VLGGFCSQLSAQDRNGSEPSPRKPLGVYAHVSIEDLIKGYPGPASPPPPPAQLHAYLRHMYAGVLTDPAISGLAVGMHWDHIQLSDPLCVLNHSCSSSPDGYDWSYLDDAFAEAGSAHKFVQLIITPGFDSPPWLLSKLSPCDGLFPPGTSTNLPDCGTVQFANFPEDQRSDQFNGAFVLPLPWNRLYQAAWWDFLVHLNARYNRNPTFVAMAVAEPVAGSDEFILPTSGNTDGMGNGNSTHPPLGPPADDVWAALIQNSFPDNSAYQNTDQVFIDQWKLTINEYERIFSGVTLFLGPDSGNDLPKFKQNTVLPMHLDNTLFAQDCSDAIAAAGPPNFDDTDYRSCEAKTEILSYFLTVDGPNSNAKATQVGGMTASSDTATGDLGLPGVKLLDSLAPPAAPLLGGAEFDHAVSGSNSQRQAVGCPPALGPNCTITPEQATYYVLANFFDRTSFAGFYAGASGSEPIQYLEIDIQDVQYAQANLCPNPPGLIIAGAEITLQDLLNRASHDIFAMAGHPAPLPPLTCN
jgi:hypothetical protein